MSTDLSATPGDRSRRFELGFAVVALLVAAAIQLSTVWPSLTRKADGPQEFLTAISLRSLLEDGLQVDYPTPVIGYPWTMPEGFGIYHNLAAVVARLANWPVETAGRTVALIFFLLGLPAVYLIARQWGANRAGGLLAVAFWLVSPFAHTNASAITSSSTAITLSAWWLYFFLVSRSAPSLWKGLAAAFAGVVAALAGPFGFIPFVLAGLVFAPRVNQPSTGSATSLLRVASIGLLPALVAATLWIFHTVQLRSASPYASFLASGQLWSTSSGSAFPGFGLDFWLLCGTSLFSTIVAPLSALLLVIFASGGTDVGKRLSGSRMVLATLGITLLLLVHGTASGDLGPLILFTSVVLALLTDKVFHVGGRTTWVAIGTGALVLVAQARLGYATNAEPANPLPSADDVATAVSAATTTTDLVITAGQGWDPLFSYRIKRRTVLVPAGRETDLPALIRAVGPGHDRHVGAVVVTGRYRSETAYLQALRLQFELAEKPLLQTGASDVYFPASLDADKRTLIANSPQSSLLRQEVAAPTSAPPPAAAPKPKSDAPFSMMSPLPSRYTVPYDLDAHEIEGAPCFFAHAPTTLEFDLPQGASQVELDFFMSEGSYTGKGNTDGVEVVVTLNHANGSRSELLRRSLKPVENFDDRKHQKVSLPFPKESGSSLIIESQPGPENRANFDWVYFRRIEIK